MLLSVFFQYKERHVAVQITQLPIHMVIMLIVRLAILQANCYLRNKPMFMMWMILNLLEDRIVIVMFLKGVTPRVFFSGICGQCTFERIPQLHSIYQAVKYNTYSSHSQNVRRFPSFNRDLKIARKLQPQHQPEVTSELDFAVSNVAHSSRQRDNLCFGVVAATRGLWRSKYLNRLV